MVFTNYALYPSVLLPALEYHLLLLWELDKDKRGKIEMGRDREINKDIVFVCVCVCGGR